MRALRALAVLSLAAGCTSTTSSPNSGLQIGYVMEATSCFCDGTGPGGSPVTVSCGQSACGSDGNTWNCVAPQTWNYGAVGCGDMAGSCTCTGTGPGGAQVVVNCGQAACGSDNNTWTCTAGNWSMTASGCGQQPDLTGTGGCQCHGTGPGDVPVVVNCGVAACGSDNNTWTCVSSETWNFAGVGCGGDAAPPDLSHPVDLAPPCICDGTGPGGVPVQVNCGQSACGSDNNTWSCVSSQSWSFAQMGCGPVADMSGPVQDLSGGPCSCDGTGPGGTPVTVGCGHSACGSDDNTWTCVSNQGWAFAGPGCGGDAAPPDLSTPRDLSTPCTCTGTGPTGAAVTVNCGQSACGSDSNTWACDQFGWFFQSFGCAAQDMAGVCQCHGTGPGNQPVVANCGEFACGMDLNTWQCTANESWSYASNGCT